MPPGDVTVGPSSPVPKILSGPLLLTEQPAGSPETSTRQRMKSECFGWSLLFLQVSSASRILIPSPLRPISLPPSSHLSTLASCLQSLGSEGPHVGAGVNRGVGDGVGVGVGVGEGVGVGDGVGVGTSFSDGTQSRRLGEEKIGRGAAWDWLAMLTEVENG